MKNRFRGRVVCIGVLGFAALLQAQMAQAQTTPLKNAASSAIPRTADGKPDLAGTWRTVSSRVEPMQLTAWGVERFAYNKLPKGEGARPELDPINHCYRPGLARIGPPLRVPAKSIRVRLEDESVPFPGDAANFDVIEIHYAPRKLWMLYQFNHEVRQIFTDGREHPENVEYEPFSRWWNGHSTGAWDGDTFIVDTANLRNETWLDSAGHEHQKLHIVERFRRVDATTMEIERTLTDPAALAKPWVTRATLKLSPEQTFQENVICDQYYVRKLGFGFGGLLGINDHPWQSPEENPNASWEGNYGTPSALEGSEEEPSGPARE